MPHISVKMIEGRADEQKKLLTENLVKAMCDSIGCGAEFVSIEINEFSPKDWQQVYAEEIAGNQKLTKQPNYDPKSLL